MSKSKINITIDKDLLEKIEKEAEKEQRSRSNFINKILRAFFTKKGKDKA